MQGIGDEPADISEPERSQHNLVDPCSSFVHRLECRQKRVSEADLVVAVGADKQNVPHVRVRDQMLKEIERCCI
jgi:hypothetical protein